MSVQNLGNNPMAAMQAVMPNPQSSLSGLGSVGNILQSVGSLLSALTPMLMQAAQMSPAQTNMGASQFAGMLQGLLQGLGGMLGGMPGGMPGMPGGMPGQFRPQMPPQFGPQMPPQFGQQMPPQFGQQMPPQFGMPGGVPGIGPQMPPQFGMPIGMPGFGQGAAATTGAVAGVLQRNFDQIKGADGRVGQPELAAAARNFSLPPEVRQAAMAATNPAIFNQLDRGDAAARGAGELADGRISKGDLSAVQHRTPNTAADNATLSKLLSPQGQALFAGDGLVSARELGQVVLTGKLPDGTTAPPGAQQVAKELMNNPALFSRLEDSFANSPAGKGVVRGDGQISLQDVRTALGNGAGPAMPGMSSLAGVAQTIGSVTQVADAITAAVMAATRLKGA